MNIAICANVQMDREAVIGYIRHYCAEQYWECNIDEYCSFEELQDRFAFNSYHIIFMDLYSHGEQGIKCAEGIRNIDEKVILIFITDIEDYFQEGYRLGVRHYLIKPIEEFSVRSSIRRSSRYISELRQNLEVISDNTTVQILLHDIQYIERIDDASIIHTDQFLIKTNTDLNELEKRVENRKFLRSHKSYLINMDAISGEAEDTFQIKNGDEVPISVTEKSAVLEKYLNYNSGKR